MKRGVILLGVAMAALGLLAAACGPDYQQQAQQLTTQVQALTKDNAALKTQVAQLTDQLGPPPASLDQYYPPKSPAPVYLLQMLAIDSAFTSIGVDLAQGDIAGVKANFATFKTEWTKASKMVPEWESKFLTKPVDDLGKAIDGGDAKAIADARAPMGRTMCGPCHAENRYKVYAKYDWPSFASATVKDPVTGATLPWQGYMFLVSASFDGIGNDLGQGQLANAIKNYDDMVARFAALREGCKNCHDPSAKPAALITTERTYFVDATQLKLVSDLGVALKATPPNAAAIGPLFQKIGEGTCGGCHLVHQTVAVNQRAFAAAAAPAAPAAPTTPAAPR